MNKNKRYLILVPTFVVCLCVVFFSVNASQATLNVTSSAFGEGEEIPSVYTCDGKNISPSLRWSKGPKGTESFIVIAEDPDAPGKTWIHWILYDLPPSVFYLPKGFPPIRKLANAEKHGTNDFKKLGYGGPCPPDGEHEYQFKVYALDTMLNQNAGLTYEEVKKAMEGHILAQGALKGRYSRKKT